MSQTLCTSLGHLTVFIDCCHRSIIYGRLSSSSKADYLIPRSDNGLVFGAKNFLDVMRRFTISKKCITPDTVYQNVMIKCIV